MPALQALTLAFSGGGAKCAAEAGVLSVLAAAGLPVRAIAGVSGGGVVRGMLKEWPAGSLSG